MNPIYKKIALILIAALAVVRIVSLFPKSTVPTEAFKHYQVLGSIAAEQLASKSTPNTHIIAVFEKSEERHLKAVEKAFMETTVQLGLKNISLVNANNKDYDSRFGLSEDFFQEILDGKARPVIIVSFIGLPPKAFIHNYQKFPSDVGFISVLPNSEFANKFLESGMVDLIISPAISPPAQTPEINSPTKVWFDAYYTILTPGQEQSSAYEDIVTDEQHITHEIIDDFLTPQKMD